MRDLILKNSEWYRGKGTTGSALLLEDGRRCCLGIDAKARGIPDGCLLHKGYPEEVLAHVDGATEYRADWVSRQSQIAKINDNHDFTDEERVERLRPYFETRGINLIFDPVS